MKTVKVRFKWELWFLFFSLNVLGQSTRTQIATKMCLEVDGNVDEMTIIFRLLKKSDRIEAINVYSASESNPKDSSIISQENCTINGTGVEGDPFEIILTINVNLANPAPQCGIYKVSDTVFRLRVRTFEFEGFSSASDAFYDCECDTMNQLPVTEQITAVLVIPSDDHIVILQPEKLLISFEVYNSEGMSTSAVTLGENVYLNMLFYSTNIPNRYDTCGTEFWIAFPELLHTSLTTVSRTLLIYKKSSDEIKITVSNSTYHTTYSIQTFFYPLTLDLADHINNEKASDKVLRLDATEEICVIMLYKDDNYRSILTLHPADTLGTEYVLVGPAIDNMFVVIITENNTDVTIQSSSVTLNLPSDTTGLHQFSSIQGWSSESISGVRISSNKPVAVICGSKGSTNTPDPSFEQMPDITKLGSTFIFPPSEGDIICSSADSGTTIEYGGQLSSVTIGPYQEANILLSHDTFLEVKSSSVVICAQNAVFNASTYSHDLTIIPPIIQWSSLYTFAAYLNKEYKLSIAIKQGTENVLQIKGRSSTIYGSSITWSSVLSVTSVGSYVGGIYTTPTNFGPYFTISHPSETFLVVMEDVQTGRGVTVPPGFHLSHINENGGCTPTLGYPGDLVDNDCDGLVDEDIDTNADTGGNALDMRTESDGTPMAVRIRPLSCLAKPNDNWDDGGISVSVTGDNGCLAGTPGNPFIPEHTFRLMSTDTSYPQRYSTGQFEIHRFLGEPKVFFRCKVQLCYSVSDTSCTTAICTTRRKRSSNNPGDVQKETSIDVQGIASRNTATDTTSDSDERTCFQRPAYIGTLCAMFVPLLICLIITIFLFQRFNTALEESKLRKRHKGYKTRRNGTHHNGDQGIEVICNNVKRQ